MTEGVGLAVLIFVLLQIYFLPGAIAGYRNCSNRGWIVLLNVLTGLTCVAWVAAFIWACVDKPLPRRHRQPRPQVRVEPTSEGTA